MKWTIKVKKLNEISPAECNPRRMDAVQAMGLEVSMRKYGVCQPVVCNTDGTIIGGHQRLAIAQRMGLEEIEVAYPEETLTDEAVKELSIRLNRNQGEWDYDLLADVYEIDSLLEWGFSDKDLELAKEDVSEKPMSHKLTLTSESREDINCIADQINAILIAYPTVTLKISK